MAYIVQYMPTRFAIKSNLMKHIFHVVSFAFALTLSVSTLSVQAQGSVYGIRAMSYNLLAFGLTCDGVNLNDKYGWLETILSEAKPDLLAVQEVAPNISYPNNIINRSIIYSGKMDFAWYNQPKGDRVNILFYNTELFGLLEVGEIPSNSIRTLNRYKLYFKPSVGLGDTTFLTVIVAHFKANVSEDLARWDSSIDIMNWIEANAPTDNILMMGDLNIYGSNENAYKEMVVSGQTTVKLVDPLGLVNGWGNANHAIHHTQSPRASSSDCGSSGGMDDRFDFILHSESIRDNTKGMRYVSSSYRVMGNNGQSYDRSLNCSGNNTVPTRVCLNLNFMSDHLPVISDFEANGVATSLDQARFIDAGVSYAYGIDEWQLSWDQPISQETQLRVVDLQGREVVQPVTIPLGKQQMTVPHLHLPSGIYLLILQQADGTQYTQKVLAQ